MIGAACAALVGLPAARLLDFFARPGPDEGSYTSEQASECVGRLLDHVDPLVVATAAGALCRAAARAFLLVEGPAALQAAWSHRGHESWAAALRFGEVSLYQKEVLPSGDFFFVSE